MLQHLDSQGREIRVGDTVSFGLATGTVHLLETYPASGYYPETAGVYVDNIGQWGSFRSVPADRVTLVV